MSRFPTPPFLRRILRWFLQAAAIVVAIVLAVILVRAFDSRRLPDLKPWHSVVLDEEFRAGMRGVDDFADYLALEERLRREVEDTLHRAEAPDSEVGLDRFDPRSASFPGRFSVNWNYSVELHPTEVRGGALLLHGLSDSPYSLRAVAELLRDRGYYVLVPRLPGHGTAPASLTEVEWRDWTEVVRLGAERVRRIAGANGEVILGGYSNGGALALLHTLESLDEAPPDRLLLFSPAVGVSGFARFASWHRLLSGLPWFEKFRWLSVRPEYDPFKYNSFPKNAGHQIWRLTEHLHSRLERAARKGELEEFPPVLAFQSLVDSTVLTGAIVERLFDRLPPGGHELVLFDTNRLESMRPFLRPSHEALHRRMVAGAELPYAVSLITNVSPDTGEVGVRRRPPGAGMGPVESLGLAWPRQVYSLSHVAIPFSPEDPIYGDGSGAPDPRGPWLGRFRPRGERGLLLVPLGQFMRLRYNPFFAYVEERLAEAVSR